MAKLWIERGLFYSKAYKELSEPALKVLLQFYLKARYKKVTVKDSREEWQIENNGEIKFSYIEAKDKFGYTKPRFSRALDMLIERGFIEISHQGGGLQGDFNKFSIIESWKRYGKQDFKFKPRKKSCRKIGFMRDK